MGNGSGGTAVTCSYVPDAGRDCPIAGDLRGGLEFERLIAELSSRFIHLAAREMDAAIESALRTVCEPLGIDMAVLWQWSDAVPRVIAPTHAYLAHGGPRPSEPMKQDDYPWSVGEMLAGRTIRVSSPEGLPAAAAVDRETCRRYGIRAALCVPLALGGEPAVGALGFNDLRGERDWPDSLVKRLELVAGVFANALARRRHDVALRESEERLALAADSAEAGLWTLDYGSGSFWTTNRARAIFSYQEGERITMEALQARIHPEDWPRVRGAIDRSARELVPVEVEYRIVSVDQAAARWIYSRGRPVSGSAGQALRLSGLSIDVTERKRAEEAQRAGRDRLAAATDLAQLAFYEVDFDARTVFVDDGFRELSGLPADRARDLEPIAFWLEHVHPDERERIVEMRERLHAGEVDAMNFDYRYVHPTRGELWLHHVARVTRRDAAGRAAGTFGVVRDITERKKREDALRQSLAEIERLKNRLQAESDYLKAEIRVFHPPGEITGQSPAVEKVLRLVHQVAPTGALVLVSGETGSGKELVAQAIHRLSPRRSRVMVKVNCAALPAGLVESELFGRERGAYTGALTRQVGRFEVADGSTLFLDEIGELSLEVQSKLLRVLETGEFERLGSPKTVKVDVRLVAATNRDLLEEVRRGRFRQDLYYRLNVFPIRVPPLRERAEDIPALVWTFLEEFSARMGKKITQVPRKTMDALQRYSWPGNVRELRNAVEHGAIITVGDTLRMPPIGDAAGAPVPDGDEKLADSERRAIERALEARHGRVKGPGGAAAALGLKPSTLYSRMKKLGIQLPGQEGESPARE